MSEYTVKQYTVKAKVMLEVELTIEVESDTTKTPAEIATVELQCTSVRDWHQRLNADWDITDIQITEVVDG